MTKEEPPIGYVKVYNPILWMTILIAMTLTMATTFVTLWLFYSDASDRALTMFLIIVSFAELNVTIGLWALTYKYARISEEPLTKLKRLAQNAEVALDWWETILFVLSPLFNRLKEFKDSFTYKPGENNKKEAQPSVKQVMVSPEVAQYLENITEFLRNMDGRLKNVESHVRDEDEEPGFGMRRLKD